EAATGLSPGDENLLDTVLGACTARHVGLEDGLELARIQVPPTSRLGIVARTRLAALGTFQGHSLASAEANDHGLALEVEIDIDDKPRLRKVEDLGIQITVAHNGPPDGAPRRQDKTTGGIHPQSFWKSRKKAACFAPRPTISRPRSWPRSMPSTSRMP